MNISRCMLCLLSLLWAASGTGATLLVGNKSEASVSLIDLASGGEVARAETRPGPHEIAVSGDGRLAVVTNYGDREDGHTLCGKFLFDLFEYGKLPQTRHSPGAPEHGKNGQCKQDG